MAALLRAAQRSAAGLCPTLAKTSFAASRAYASDSESLELQVSFNDAMAMFIGLLGLCNWAVQPDACTLQPSVQMLQPALTRTESFHKT